ncbi:glycoside hydrolase family 47 protein [Fistulina hepatica ATCC 64428]|uniref:alpha-1,2-Mannosidase n=1 Tax=Fistulina hepatica ATCC 64428 TaxID=1128425 RepID=A0A0D7A5I7_9AGAR|nr:glycoside hydrolase family 47 protein [Fistulina hepatica ATCC 64428]
MAFVGVLTTLLLVFSSCRSVVAGAVQSTDLQLPSDADTYKQGVVDVFRISWAAYKKYAWGHDDLEPVTGGYADSRNGWGSSLVDALSTAVLARLAVQDIFEEGVNHTLTVDFTESRTDDSVSVFETTIRYVGGMLSAYELNGSSIQGLVDQTQTLVDKLALAYSEDSAIPYGYIWFNNNSRVNASTTIAGAGTLDIEWGRLSNFTGNSTYLELAEATVKHIGSLTPPLPGFPARDIWPSNGEFDGSYITWGSGTDSYLEYLIKYARLTNTDDDFFVSHWLAAVDTTINELFRTSTVGDWLYTIDIDDDGQVLHINGHLACFYGANWLLGGKLTDNETIVDYGLQLNEACWNTYNSTASGLGPVEFAFMSDDGDYTGGSAPEGWNLDFYEEHGWFYYSDDTAYYTQQPEIIESNFYAWRVTGDTKYIDRAVSVLHSINTYMPALAGYAGFVNVSDPLGERENDLQRRTGSPWFAEVMGYLYLTFDDPTHISLDDYVFTTECHPFKAPTAKSTYGTSSTVARSVQDDEPVIDRYSAKFKYGAEDVAVGSEKMAVFS